MPMMAVAFPILPGKTAEWRAWMEEVNGPRRDEFDASRKAAGVHERTFLQQTPHGDMVIVTMEGENPEQAFATFTQSTDPFSEWFLAQVQAIHGIDLRQPMPGPPPELVIDSGA